MSIANWAGSLKQQKVDFHLTFLGDHCFARLGTLPGIGALLFVDFAPHREDALVDILLGDRRNLFFDLWGRHIGQEIARRAGRPVLLALALPFDLIENKAELRAVAAELAADLDAIPPNHWRRVKADHEPTYSQSVAV